MNFKGLFVGIGKYASPKINWLSFAKRDAEALYALMTDTFGEGATLLVDESATKDAIEREFQNLFDCNPDDIVVIAFSGHGTSTHQLVCYDTEPFVNRLIDTAISLETLTEWFSRIPAKRLICILDCCFSGGMGAKVLQIDAASKEMLSAEHALEQMSGEGRMILTASGPQEQAWESPKLCHSLLTYFVIEALKGPEDVRQGSKIPIYRLLQYVTQRVIDSGDQLGISQHPTLRGTIDGELSWPIFTPGTLYLQLFPEYERAKVTNELPSLTAYGFPPALIQAWTQSIPSLNDLQLAAINDFDLLAGAHLIVSAPTSSGKTLIGELAALKGVLVRRRALFLFPLKALVNDKLRQFHRIYGEFGIKTIQATGETDDIGPLIRSQYDICLLTYEKFASVILTNPHVLNQVGTIVIDEVQMITDLSRGANLEFVLTLLQMRRMQGVEPQLIALSAVIGDTCGLERWMNARLLRRAERPIPLDEGLLRADTTFRYLDASTNEERIVGPLFQRLNSKNSSQDWLIPLVQKLVSEGQQVLIFRETRGEARNVARYLVPYLHLSSAKSAIDQLPADDQTSASRSLRETLHGGVAFHISDLNPEERRVIEDEFRKKDSSIRVIVATTTLAMGVNTPAESVIIVGLNHPGNVPYSVAEYKNMIGRAGRLGYSNTGTSYLFALSDHDEHFFWSQYVKGLPESLTSHFLTESTDIRSIIIRSMIHLQTIYPHGIPQGEIARFIESSFGVFLLKQSRPNWQMSLEELATKFAELETHNLIHHQPNGTYLLTKLGWIAGSAVIEIESIIRVVDLLRSVSPIGITDPTLIAAAQVTVEVDQIIFPMNKASIHKEPAAWFGALQQQAIPEPVILRLSNWIQERHQPTLRAKKAVASLMYITPKSLLEIEETLTQFGRNDSAAGAILSVTSRVCDVLPTIAQVAELLHPTLNLADRVTRLLIRLNLGVPVQIIDLALYAGADLARGDYLRLLERKLSDMNTLANSDDEVILQVMNGNLDKLAIIRRAVNRYNDENRRQSGVVLLEPYEG